MFSNYHKCLPIINVSNSVDVIRFYSENSSSEKSEDNISHSQQPSFVEECETDDSQISNDPGEKLKKKPPKKTLSWSHKLNKWMNNWNVI